MRKRTLSLALMLVLTVSILSGCTQSTQQNTTTPPTTTVSETSISTPEPSVSTPEPSVPLADEVEPKVPKYVFLFIGDGMSHAQINAAQVYQGNNTPEEIAFKKLDFTQFPVVGMVTTQNATSFIPDSASTATAIAAGVKTHRGVLGLEMDKTTSVTSIAEKLKAEGKKIGIVTSVPINHATPAAFYAHIPARNDYYDIAMQMADSEFEYFAGGTISSPTGKEEDQKDAFEVLAEKGYTVVDTSKEIRELDNAAGKVYAVSPILQDSGSMPYALDAADDDIKLEEFVQKGIDVLDNDNGFFMMVESGKIDWANHANDGMSSIGEVQVLDNAIKKAVEFAQNHSDETLIIVTADHETGGMSIGNATTDTDTKFHILEKQKMSHIAFDELIMEMKEENPDLSLVDLLPVIKEKFGIMTKDDPDGEDEENAVFVLTDYEYNKLADGFAQSMLTKDARENTEETHLLYGKYDPLSVTITHILNNKAGIGWTTYGHTGTPVPVFAMGVGAELFGGSYDNTDINKKILEITGLK